MFSNETAKTEFYDDDGERSPGLFRELTRHRKLNRWLVNTFFYGSFAFVISSVMCAGGMYFKKLPDIVGLVVAGQTGRAVLLQRLRPTKIPALEKISSPGGENGK